ncbi:MAG TPA: DUF4399 domain-containing protein [Candidatus Thermoplasmatota archaeon]
MFVAVAISGCAATQPAAVNFQDVPSAVDGNVVTLSLLVSGFKIVAPDGDTTGATGHFHVFVDRDPPGVGAVIPREPTILHSVDPVVRVYGLAVGAHQFKVVLGDGAHRRVHADAMDSADVVVRGPSVSAQAPSIAPAGENVTLAIQSQGVEIRGADGDTSGASGHYHILVDPAADPVAGETIGPAEPGRIIHTAADSVELSGLAVGSHTLWVVVGDGAHRAFAPAVMARLSVTVE